MSRLPSALTPSQSSVLGGIGVRPLTEAENARIYLPAHESYRRMHPKAIENRDSLVALGELADPSALTQLITEAENLAKSHETIASAVGLLGRCQRIFDAQKAQAEVRRRAKNTYEYNLRDARTKLQQLENTANANRLPLEDLIISATGLAEGGQDLEAGKKLWTVLDVFNAQTAKAANEPGKRDEYMTQLAIAEQVLGFLRLDQYREFVDPSDPPAAACSLPVAMSKNRRVCWPPVARAVPSPVNAASRGFAGTP